ncbi:MAG: TIGR00341 family protein [Thermodesulfobacteriota bacterium]
MSLRLIEIILPETENLERLRELLEDEPIIEIWEDLISGDRILIEILVKAEESEKILDLLEKRFSKADHFRIILLPVEASIPRPEKPKKEDEEDESSEAANGKEENSNVGRISREELYANMDGNANITSVYLVMVVLSSIVASIGILKDNVAIIIGAMVIAPLLGPNMALALGTTLGDTDLIGRALKANLAGIAATLVLSIVIGIVFAVDPAIGELSSRTQVGLGDIAIALAAGVAGTLSFTKGLPSALIGVMVAVALLPPTVTVGMLLGSNNMALVPGAVQLVLVNIICVNLAGVTTFFFKGVRPRTWWETKKAQKATRTAIIIWSVLLIILVATILKSQGYL